MTRGRQTHSRRHFLRTAGAATLGALALSGQTGCAQTRDRNVDRPNLLWITCEDMSPNLGCWGDPYARTPNLDRLAAQSVRYTNAFATAPICSPTRSCLITGVVTAMPYFLDSFLQCLAGNGSSGGDDVYQPGDRTRCAP